MWWGAKRCRKALKGRRDNVVKCDGCEDRSERKICREVRCFWGGDGAVREVCCIGMGTKERGGREEVEVTLFVTVMGV